MSKPLPPLVSKRQLAGYAIDALLYAPLIVGGGFGLLRLIHPAAGASFRMSVLLTAAAVLFAVLFLIQFVIGVLDPKSKGLGIGAALVRRRSVPDRRRDPRVVAKLA